MCTIFFRFVLIWHFYCTMSRGLLFYRTQCSIPALRWPALLVRPTCAPLDVAAAACWRFTDNGTGNCDLLLSEHLKMASAVLRRACKDMLDLTWCRLLMMWRRSAMYFARLTATSTETAIESIYTVFHKKGPLFVFFIIYSNNDQFTPNFYQLWPKKYQFKIFKLNMAVD